MKTLRWAPYKHLEVVNTRRVGLPGRARPVSPNVVHNHTIALVRYAGVCISASAVVELPPPPGDRAGTGPKPSMVVRRRSSGASPGPLPRTHPPDQGDKNKAKNPIKNVTQTHETIKILSKPYESVLVPPPPDPPGAGGRRPGRKIFRTCY